LRFGYYPNHSLLLTRCVHGASWLLDQPSQSFRQ
jgi:hypothetical protein